MGTKAPEERPSLAQDEKSWVCGERRRRAQGANQIALGRPAGTCLFRSSTQCCRTGLSWIVPPGRSVCEQISALCPHEKCKGPSQRTIACSGQPVLNSDALLIDNHRSKMKQLVITKKSKSPGRISTTVRALKHRNFQLFFGGQLISLVGTWMQSVAQSWLVYEKTHSSLKLGLVGFASQIPVFLVAPLGGIVADRNNRHRVVIGTQIASMVLAFMLAALTLSQRIQVWHIFCTGGIVRRRQRF